MQWSSCLVSLSTSMQNSTGGGWQQPFSTMSLDQKLAIEALSQIVWMNLTLKHLNYNFHLASMLQKVIWNDNVYCALPWPEQSSVQDFWCHARRCYVHSLSKKQVLSWCTTILEWIASQYMFKWWYIQNSLSSHVQSDSKSCCHVQNSKIGSELPSL